MPTLIRLERRETDSDPYFRREGERKDAGRHERGEEKKKGRRKRALLRNVRFISLFLYPMTPPKKGKKRRKKLTKYVIGKREAGKGEV